MRELLALFFVLTASAALWVWRHLFSILTLSGAFIALYGAYKVQSPAVRLIIIGAILLQLGRAARRRG